MIWRGSHFAHPAVVIELGGFTIFPAVTANPRTPSLSRASSGQPTNRNAVTGELWSTRCAAGRVWSGSLEKEEAGFRPKMFHVAFGLLFGTPPADRPAGHVPVFREERCVEQAGGECPG